MLDVGKYIRSLGATKKTAGDESARALPPVDEKVLQQVQQSLSNITLPDDYLAFLRLSDGLTSESGWINSATDALRYTREYRIEQEIPGALLVGSDGGGNAYALLHQSGRSVYFNLNLESPGTKGDWEYLGDNFATFLEHFLDPDKPRKAMPPLPKPKRESAKTKKKAGKVDGLVVLCKAKDPNFRGDIPQFAFGIERDVANTYPPYRRWNLESCTELPYESSKYSLRAPHKPGPLYLKVPGEADFPYDPVLARKELIGWIGLAARSYSSCISPDQNRYAYTSVPNPHHSPNGLWDLNTGAIIAPLPPSSDSNVGLLIVFSPDSQWLGLAQPWNGAVTIYSATDGQLRYSFESQQQLTHIAFAPDGRAVTCGNQVNVYDASTGKVLSTVSLLEPPPGFAVVDNTRVLIGQHDGTVQLLDLRDGKQLAVFKVPAGACEFLGVSPDSKWAMFTGEKASSIYRWRIPPENS